MDKVKILESTNIEELDKNVQSFLKDEGITKIDDIQITCTSSPHKGYYINYSYVAVIRYNLA